MTIGKLLATCALVFSASSAFAAIECSTKSVGYSFTGYTSKSSAVAACRAHPRTNNPDCERNAFCEETRDRRDGGYGRDDDRGRGGNGRDDGRGGGGRDDGRGGQQPPRREQAPGGSYLLTCRSVSRVNNVLYAECKNMKGKYKYASLSNVDRCVSEIANNDGRLVCNMR